jgi:hypothetical protein
MIKNFDKPKNKIVDFATTAHETKMGEKTRVEKKIRNFLKNY